MQAVSEFVSAASNTTGAFYSLAKEGFGLIQAGIGTASKVELVAAGAAITGSSFATIECLVRAIEAKTPKQRIAYAAVGGIAGAFLITSVFATAKNALIRGCFDLVTSMPGMCLSRYSPCNCIIAEVVMKYCHGK